MTQLYDQLVYKIPEFRSNKHYRVGDVLLKHGIRWEQDRQTIINSNEFDGTILARYLKRLTAQSHWFDRSFIRKCLRRSASQDLDIRLLHEEIVAYARERNIVGCDDNELVLQLRTGDAIAPDEGDTVRGQNYLIFRQDDIEQQISEMFDEPPQRVKLVTAMHFGDNEINNMYKFSERKLEVNRQLISDVITRLRSILPDTDIDIYSNHSLSSVECIDSDLCFLMLSKNLIHDIGGFSEIVSRLQKLPKKE